MSVLIVKLATVLVFCCCVSISSCYGSDKFPIVINTWGFSRATEKAWEVVNSKGMTALDALVAGCSLCEAEQCDHTVGYGGSPNENGETTLDALIIDGEKQDVGAVGGMPRIKSAIGVARMVLEHTDHSILIGDEATKFAIKMGFKETNLTTPYSYKLWQDWKKNNCQPNFWKNVKPDPKQVCGPYKQISIGCSDSKKSDPDSCKFKLKKYDVGHDTIGMIVIDKEKKIYAGTSTNGAKFKIPGRVGDGPIPGAGAYADVQSGGAAATGDGDITLRFLPSFLAVIKMKEGMSPASASEYALKNIKTKYPLYNGAIVSVNMNGEYGAACLGFPFFNFSVATNSGGVTVKSIPCQ